MKRNNAEQIGELIRHYLRQESLESPLNERRLISAWPEVLGPTIASYTRELYIKNQVLYVHLTSAALRQELMMGRELLVRNLNRHVGAQGITNIIFRRASSAHLFFQSSVPLIPGLPGHNTSEFPNPCCHAHPVR